MKTNKIPSLVLSLLIAATIAACGGDSPPTPRSAVSGIGTIQNYTDVTVGESAARSDGSPATTTENIAGIICPSVSTDLPVVKIPGPEPGTESLERVLPKGFFFYQTLDSRYGLMLGAAISPPALYIAGPPVELVKLWECATEADFWKSEENLYPRALLPVPTPPMPPLEKAKLVGKVCQEVSQEVSTELPIEQHPWGNSRTLKVAGYYVALINYPEIGLEWSVADPNTKYISGLGVLVKFWSCGSHELLERAIQIIL